MGFFSPPVARVATGILPVPVYITCGYQHICRVHHKHQHTKQHNEGGTCPRPIGSLVCSAPTDSVENVDSFLSLVKEIEASDFFPQLDLNNRLLTFEMLTAAETRNLKLLFDRLGYIVLLEYIDALPKDYQHRFVRYSIMHLLSEYPPATDATSN